MWGWDCLEGGDRAESGASRLSPVPSWAIWTSCACFSPRLNSPGKTVTKDSRTMPRKNSRGTEFPSWSWSWWSLRILSREAARRLAVQWEWDQRGSGLSLRCSMFYSWGKCRGLWIKLSDSWGAGRLFNSSLSHSLNTAKGIWNLAHIDHIIGANGTWASPNQWVLNEAHWLLGLVCRAVTLPAG